MQEIHDFGIDLRIKLESAMLVHNAAEALWSNLLQQGHVCPDAHLI